MTEDLQVCIDSTYRQWHHAALAIGDGGAVEAWVRGAAWLEDRLLAGQDLAEWSARALLLPDGASIANLGGALLGLNGFFALVVRGPGQLVAAVDRSRSIPLFYAADDARCIVGNTADGVATAFGDCALRPELATEFLLSGLIAGPDTLLRRVSQLQAGELLVMRTDPARPVALEALRYFRREPREDTQATRKELLGSLDGAVRAAIERLIATSRGRTIAVALSGGHDSRLIVSLLKQAGAERLVAFSYGVNGNLQAGLSRQVAERLGVPWYMATYTPQAWHDIARHADWAAYLDYGGQKCMTAHIQDWLALRMLRERPPFDGDMVIVPGHTGTFTGAHVPEAYIPDGSHQPEQVREHILASMYALWPLPARSSRWDVLRQRVTTLAELYAPLSAEQACEVYERWDWAERQSKFITNSVRAYEFWGCDWWLPLCDAALFDLWLRVPRAWRAGRRLYHTYCEAQAAQVGLEALPATSQPSAPRPRWRAAKRLVSRLGLWPQARELARVMDLLAGRPDDPLAWYGAYPQRAGWRAIHWQGGLPRVGERFSIHSLVCREYLERLGLE
jgi:asparagine synthase (glutamine-hydrolysing)